MSNVVRCVEVEGIGRVPVEAPAPATSVVVVQRLPILLVKSTDAEVLKNGEMWWLESSGRGAWKGIPVFFLRGRE